MDRVPSQTVAPPEGAGPRELACFRWQTCAVCGGRAWMERFRAGFWVLAKIVRWWRFLGEGAGARSPSIITMRVIRTLILACLAVACGMQCAAAELTWTRDRVRLTVDNTVVSVHASFPYRNTGSKAVRVLVARPSCDCMVVGDSSFVVGPGKEGALDVTLRLMGQVGSVRKELWVATDAPDASPQRLELDVEVHERIAVRPRMLFWTLGDEPSAKTIRVAVSPEGSARLLGVRTSGGEFLVATEPGAAPGTWILSVHPVDTKSRRNGSAALDFAGSDGAPLKVEVYLVVR